MRKMNWLLPMVVLAKKSSVLKFFNCYLLNLFIILKQLWNKGRVAVSYILRVYSYCFVIIVLYFDILFCSVLLRFQNALRLYRSVLSKRDVDFAMVPISECGIFVLFATFFFFFFCNFKCFYHEQNHSGVT